MSYNAGVEKLRDVEYPTMRGTIYLDHAGMPPCPKTLMEKFASDMTSNLIGNPHSASASSQLATFRIEDIRLKVLQLFNADPDDFDVVFVANATAGIKLVVEAIRSRNVKGFDFAYHYASHTSLIGVREEAQNSVCLDDLQVCKWLDGQWPFNDGPDGRTVLFGYPAQSNMDGCRMPLEWANRVRTCCSSSSTEVYTLLDAASLVASSPLDLSLADKAPDFTVLSFYKVFGFPDLGALVVRRHAWPVFDSRRYFGGGTVDMVVCLKDQWKALKSSSLHARLEDGTLPVHSIMALDTALSVHSQLFESITRVEGHVAFLTRKLYSGLKSLTHGDGTTVCILYSPDPNLAAGSGSVGPIVAFNLRNQSGTWISLAEFEKLAASKNIHVRTGGVCNPGGIASALGLQSWELARNFSAGHRCGTVNDIVAGKPTGVIRASLGAMSTISDVDQFVAFIDEFYRDPASPHLEVIPGSFPSSTASFHVQSIWVYPIKSCGGFPVPPTKSWEVRPEGLAWDREWCLIHRGSGQALSQTRHPQMCLIRPHLDFDRGELQVTFGGHIPGHLPTHISVPLSSDPALLSSSYGRRPVSSRVCGEEVYAQTYISSEINSFFSGVLGVQCMLARFPPGGQGKGMRRSKAQFHRHQTMATASSVPARVAGPFPPLPSPPESDSEHNATRILLSNESPILVINLSSLEELNHRIVSADGNPVMPTVFRANIVIASSGPGAAYAEDKWRTLRIGQQQFSMLGSCRRCNMVCINQETAERAQEPFVTLFKTRKFDGRVFFGDHMKHCPSTNTAATRGAQHPTIQIGDIVQPDTA